MLASHSNKAGGYVGRATEYVPAIAEK